MVFKACMMLGSSCRQFRLNSKQWFPVQLCKISMSHDSKNSPFWQSTCECLAMRLVVIAERRQPDTFWVVRWSVILYFLLQWKALVLGKLLCPPLRISSLIMKWCTFDYPKCPVNCSAHQTFNYVLNYNEMERQWWCIFELNKNDIKQRKLGLR